MTRLLLVVGSVRVAAGNSPLIYLIMDLKEKQQFDNWLLQNYPKLYKKLRDTDSLHNAYITVVGLPVVIPDDYMPFLLQAYLKSRRSYAAYVFRFVVPDPRFWLFQEEIPDLDEMLTHRDNTERQELHERQLDAFRKWVSRHYATTEQNIFRMFYHERLDISHIARLTGMSKSTVSNIIKDMCDGYKNNKGMDVEKQKDETPASSTSKNMSMCFYISKNEKYIIIPSATCIKRMGLAKGSRLCFEYDGANRYVKTVRPYEPYNIELKTGCRNYNLRGYDKNVVKFILGKTGAKRSVTLQILPTTGERFVIDIDNPIKKD